MAIKSKMCAEIAHEILKKRKRDNNVLSLSDVLWFLKKKFKLNELTAREISLVAAWRYQYDDLSKQYKTTVAYVYYLVMVPLPKHK